MVSAKTPIGFGLPCPLCRADDVGLHLDLNDLTQVGCEACGESFTVRRALELAAASLRRWEAVAKWLHLSTAIITEVNYDVDLR